MMLPLFDFWTVYREWTWRLELADETSVTVRQVNNKNSIVVLAWRARIHGKPYAGEHHLDAETLAQHVDLAGHINMLASKAAKTILDEMHKPAPPVAEAGTNVAE